MIQEPASNDELLYERVASRIGKLIDNGVLRPGDRIPSVRRSSRQHGVSVSTAVQAYLALEDRGLIEARPKSGFYVRPRLHRVLAEPRASRPSASAALVGNTALMARIFEAASRPDVVPLGAGCPSDLLLPTAKLHRLLAAASRTHGARGIATIFRPAANRCDAAARPAAWGCHLGPRTSSRCAPRPRRDPQPRAVTCRATSSPPPAYFGVLRRRTGRAALKPRIARWLDLDAPTRRFRRRRVAACVVTEPQPSCPGPGRPQAHARRAARAGASSRSSGTMRRRAARVRPPRVEELRHEGPLPASFRRRQPVTRGWCVPGGSSTR